MSQRFRRAVAAVVTAAVLALIGAVAAAEAQPPTGQIVLDSFNLPGATTYSDYYYLHHAPLFPILLMDTKPGFYPAQSGWITGVTVMAASHCPTDGCADLDFLMAPENSTGDGFDIPSITDTTAGYARVPQTSLPTPPPGDDGSYLAPFTVTFPTPLPVVAGHGYFLFITGADTGQYPLGGPGFGWESGGTSSQEFTATQSFPPPEGWRFQSCDGGCPELQVFETPSLDGPQTLDVAVTGSQTYGSAAPTFTTTMTAPDGDTLNGQLTCGRTTSGRPIDATLPAGSYAVDPASCGGLSLTGPTADSYAISYKGDAFAVLKAPLVLSVNDATRPYGLPDPPFGYALHGFVNGENASVVSGAAVLSSTATAMSDPGSYPITADVRGMSAANYRLISQPGTLSVVPATPVVTAPVMRISTAVAAHAVIFRASIHDTTATGPPAVGLFVRFTITTLLGRNISCSGTTDMTGAVTCSNGNVLDLVTAKPQAYTVSVTGNVDYTGATASGRIAL